MSDKKSASTRRSTSKLGRQALVAAAAGCFLSSGGASAGALYFDFNLNSAGGAANPALFLFGNANQSATITNNAGFNQTVSLSGDGFFNLSIPTAAAQSGTGIRNTGFQVVSADPIAGYFVNRKAFTTDMTYLLDEDALGSEYVVASTGSAGGEGSQVSIQAIEDGTTVTFTPKGGAPITVTLNEGETYKYAGGGVDLTGSTVSADKNVAVFGGHDCANVPSNVAFCDNLIEQMIPTENLSTTYLVTASQGAEITPQNSDLVRVIATEDGTEVSVDGTVVATIASGDFYQFDLAETSGALIEATSAVKVAQYLKGGNGTDTDPALALVPGSDSWLDAYNLATPSGNSAFDVNYASIVAMTSDLGGLQLDGVSVDTSGFSAIGSTGFSRGIVDLPLGLFELTSTSEFLVMLGGGSRADSYFTYGGATFAPGISPPPPDPMPAPTPLVLLGLGLFGLVARRRLS